MGPVVGAINRICPPAPTELLLTTRCIRDTGRLQCMLEPVNAQLYMPWTPVYRLHAILGAGAFL